MFHKSTVLSLASTPPSQNSLVPLGLNCARFIRQKVLTKIQLASNQLCGGIIGTFTNDPNTNACMPESKCIIHINILTKFHKDWMKTVTSIVYTRRPKYNPSPDFITTNILTKFYEDWMKTVTSIVYTSDLINILTKFHKDWIKTINILTKFHKDWMKTATSINYASDLINILTKFHKDWMKTVTSTVYTNKLLTDTRTHTQQTPDITRSHKLTM
ncbi:hypothetical protein DPMN_171219 [Dreissena polymorpha]|uniref:Uncharacterized protein n=1 Tax=Dreissena polymorpha TaxID=45954 RepID=A0A9D4IDJ6_DREPO|nr:hypothetical protein DPMN_171219 [Dreissena polymorpha]